MNESSEERIARIERFRGGAPVYEVDWLIGELRETRQALDNLCAKHKLILKKDSCCFLCHWAEHIHSEAIDDLRAAAEEHARDRERLEAALREIRKIVCDSWLSCNHDDAAQSSDECGNIDDCIFHALLQGIDAAIAKAQAK